jgi:hypothetical protein
VVDLSSVKVKNKEIKKFTQKQTTNPKGGYRYSPYFSLMSALNGVGEKNQYPLSMRLGGPHGQPERVNILFLETSGQDMEFVFLLLCVCRGSFLLNKSAGNKIGQSQLSRAEVKNERCHSSTPPYFSWPFLLIYVRCLTTTIIIIIIITVIILIIVQRAVFFPLQPVLGDVS